MTAKELRQKYFDFFREKGHTLISSASLVPENDPTVLFTTAGMHPLVPYLLGEKHPGGKRVVSAQKCVRTDDIEEVGDAVHHTFFEMLGNWSFGDYFKEDAIKWSWEFLTDARWLGIDKNHLAVSIFAGDQDAPLDEKSKQIWLSLGVPAERIAALPKKDNWWGPAGMTGPCGPDTEMFYWSGKETPPAQFDTSDERWVEIWNDVFMQYNKRPDGTFEPLKQKNVDTGMGMERTLAVLSGYDDNYHTELFWPIIEKIEELSGKKYGKTNEITRSMRIIADHIKASVFIMADGIVPANTERSYVLRRLLRRAIRYGRMLDIRDNFTADLASEVIFMETYDEIYKEIKEKRRFIREQFEQEEAKFSDTLGKALHVFKTRMITINIKDLPKTRIPDLSAGYTPPKITGKFLFDMFQTYGMPLEMSFEELARHGRNFLDFQRQSLVKEFNEEYKKHQKLSRTAAEQKFAGGLADHSEMSTKYHTATHLLHAALRRVLGEQVEQRGSNITAERLRFDFSYPNKMTAEQLKEVEDLVNDAIARDYPVSCQEMSVAAAKAQGAIGLFEGKYGDKVKVYTVGNSKVPSPFKSLSRVERGREGRVRVGRGDEIFSREICGGPHVARTGVLGKCKIIKEEAVAAGIRRIKAVLASP